MILSAGFIGMANATSEPGTAAILHETLNANAYNLNGHQQRAPPSGYGAWESINGGPWIKQKLLTQNGSNYTGPVLTPGQGGEGGSNGIEGVYASSGVINNVEETVAFSQYSGEYDSITGTSNTWSVQVNSNYFGSSNDRWVQWGLINNYDSYSQFTVVEWYDINQPGANINNFVYIPTQTLSTSIDIIITASAENGNLQGILDIVTPSGSNEWVVNLQDKYNLEGNWSSVSGTILGAAQGSTAEFTNPTTDMKWINASAPSPMNAYQSPTFITGEQNNLSIESITTNWDNYPGFYQFNLGVESSTEVQ